MLATLVFSSGLVTGSVFAKTVDEEQLKSAAVISKLMPERKHGRGFELSYLVDAALDVFWKYRTDFDNQDLLTNQFINSHRLVSREADVAITETVYSKKPNSIFRWKTTIYPDQYLLKYELLNPEECGQKYHYGYIQLERQGADTAVTQVAYFDFYGVSLWVNYPFKGGMTKFLKYTAQWEQDHISEHGNRYMN